MPMKVNVGLTKEIGLHDFGLLGATCAVEFEGEHGLLNDLDGFHQRVKHAFAACRQAIDDELARQQAQADNTDANSNQSAADVPTAPATTTSNGNGSNGHGASDKQLEYARQLAKTIEGLGIRRLESLAQKLYGKPLAALSSFDASGLIDTLKGIKMGRIDLNAMVSGETP